MPLKGQSSVPEVVLDQRSEPPRERRGRKQTRGRSVAAEEGRAKMKGEGQVQRATELPLEPRSSPVGFCWVSLHHPSTRVHLFAQLTVADPGCSERLVGLSGAGSLLPGVLLGAHQGSPQPVCGQGAAFPPRARDYREHS